jgi:hypothetical protein
MIFVAGIILCAVGLVYLFIIIRKKRRPNAEATIQEITLEFHKKDKRQLKKHPHATIMYNYKSVNYTAKIFLLKRHLQVGDNVVVSFKEDKPEKPIMSAPKQELFAALFIMFMGLSLIAASVFVMDYFNLW